MDQLFIDSQQIVNDEETGRSIMKGVGDEEIHPKSGFKVLRTNIGIEITNLETPSSPKSPSSGNILRKKTSDGSAGIDV